MMGMRALLAAILAALCTTYTIAPAAAQEQISVVSFNIQFLGQSRSRDNGALAELLADYDLVFVQEVIAPPYDGEFPDGDAFRPNPRVAAFFDLMSENGFEYVMSPEDTGRSLTNHSNGTNTEWFVAFYRPDRVSPATDLPWGFLADDVTAHPDFDRVPFAFPFRAGGADLVFISVHLRPGRGASNAERRAQELDAIWRWIRNRRGGERDYVILGDMNLETCDELAEVLPRGAVSLNHACEATNTNVRGPKPYDHVMFRTAFTAAEIGDAFEVVDLIEAMRPSWSSTRRYPGDPYNHNAFRQRYSDHHPVVFSVRTDVEDDD